MSEPEYDLFDKTELTVRGISLENVDLDKEGLADRIANRLRERLKEMSHGQVAVNDRSGLL